SSAHMTTDNLFGVYQTVPFDYTQFPNHLDKKTIEQHKINSWGIDERKILQDMDQWKIKSANNKANFVAILTSTTHHPYGLPKDVQPNFVGEGRLDRYKSSIHFIDSVIGKFYEDVVKRENALLLIVGDHGQAFGEHHKNNYTHKNHLYEENIKNFMLWIDPLANQGVTITQSGKIGDILPTVTNLMQFAPAKTIGKSLIGNYDETISYFHKDTRPEKWGLKDGNWKFITEKFTNRNPELYDLTSDPHEQINLAAQFQDRVLLYHQFCAEWYVRANNHYLSQLENFQENQSKIADIEDLKQGNINQVVIGIVDDKRNFKKIDPLPLTQNIAARISGIPFQKDKNLLFEWISPTGKINKINMRYKAQWQYGIVNFPKEMAFESGEWTVSIKSEAGEMIKVKFQL
ncbi:sulfatase-like hydrolase/transferase, partial [Dolichospermum sp. ST_sed1]|nr:sulfatase-like hydrolase/transferase [Dolichospermum sp. ST_sed1]